MFPDIFSGKKILLGVTGGIAAYKSVFLLRELMKSGAEVQVIMTESALNFVAPLTFSALSRKEVIIHTFPDGAGQSSGTWHIDTALNADLMIVAPATVNTIAKFTYGIADNALSVLFSAMRAPVLLAPAADVDMYASPASRYNLGLLASRGYYILPAEAGELASGLSGMGRLPETDKILEAAATFLMGYTKDLSGKKICVTAGPTYEDMDPVRYIGNRSTGLMGYMLAKAAYLRGAQVELISGPSHLTPYPEMKFSSIRSADELLTKLQESVAQNDILIMAAAVADYKPKEYSESKIKKGDAENILPLEKNPDILASLNKEKTFTAGFALETDNEEANAISKLKRKGLDMIILNTLKSEGTGFESPTNEVTVYTKDGAKHAVPLASKFTVAHKILDLVKKHAG